MTFPHVSLHQELHPAVGAANSGGWDDADFSLAAGFYSMIEVAFMFIDCYHEIQSRDVWDDVNL